MLLLSLVMDLTNKNTILLLLEQLFTNEVTFLIWFSIAKFTSLMSKYSLQKDRGRHLSEMDRKRGNTSLPKRSTT